MKGTSFIQWVLLLCIVAMLILFKTVHFQVIQYNLFLLLLISSAYIVILCMRILERRWLSRKEGDGQGEYNRH
jgi:hypothetical protein